MQRLSRLLVPLMLSVLVFALLRTGVQAYAVMTNVWPQGSTTYVTEQSMMDEFGWNGVYRTDEAAEHWHDETVFSFSYHAGEENWIKAYQFSSGQDRYGFMIPTEDAYGIYRDSYEIHINTAPRDEDNNVIPWYAGVGGVPGNAGDLRTVLRHEFGHAAGLHHAETGGTNQLMYKSIARGTSKGIANDERNGMRYLYEANYNATHPDNTDYWLRAYPATWDDNFFNTYVGFKGRNWIGGSPFPRASLTTMAWSDGDGTSGATSWLAFTGERITWRFAKVSNRGTNRIYIDGNYVETIDTSDPTDILWQVERTWDLSNGDHLIEYG